MSLERCSYCGAPTPSRLPDAIACVGHSDLPKLDPVYSLDAWRDELALEGAFGFAAQEIARARRSKALDRSAPRGVGSRAVPRAP